MVDPEWIFWSAAEFARIKPESNQIASILFIKRKKETGVIYKPTLTKNDANKLLGIIGRMFDEGSTPAIIKIDDDEVGSCFAVQTFDNVPEKLCPEIPLEADTVKETDWEKASNEIASISIPTLVPLPFGKEIESTSFDEAFIEEMSKISSEHGLPTYTARPSSHPLVAHSIVIGKCSCAMY